MKLNQKVRYGVGCLYELSKTPGEYIDADHIAKKQNIPPAYAHKVLQTMAHAGLIIAHKGVGYKLVRSLEDITALEVIELLTADVDPNASNPDVGVIFEERLNKALSGFSLEDFIHSK